MELKNPITKIEYYQIDFNPDWLKQNKDLHSYYENPTFRRSITGVWENLELAGCECCYTWIILNNSEDLENWFKTQNI